MPESNPPSVITDLDIESSELIDHVDGQTAAGTLVDQLRSELEYTGDERKQARLLAEIASLEERAGDKEGAARDWLIAHDADPQLREAVEALWRLFDAKANYSPEPLLDTLVQEAGSPEEKARALVLRSVQFARAHDLASAKSSLDEASELDLGSAEKAGIWLLSEWIGTKAEDLGLVVQALAGRKELASNPIWRALLGIDHAKAVARLGDAARASDLLWNVVERDEARAFDALVALQNLSNENANVQTRNGRKHVERLAQTFEQLAHRTAAAIGNAAEAERAGTPSWALRYEWVAIHAVRAALAYESIGEPARASEVIDGAFALTRGRSSSLVAKLLTYARIRLATLAKDEIGASQFADQWLDSEDDPATVAYLRFLRARNASINDPATVAQALADVVIVDPGCIPARALQFELVGESEPAQLATQIETYAAQLSSKEAKGRFFLLASFVWAAGAREPNGAKNALKLALGAGAKPSMIARLSRVLASLCEDSTWYEEATHQLLTTPDERTDAVMLRLELVRGRLANNDFNGATLALEELAKTPGGLWLSSVLDAFLPAYWDPEGVTIGRWEDRRRVALEQLAAHSPESDLARGLMLLAAARLHSAGDLTRAKEHLRQLLDAHPGDALIATYLADLERATSDELAAAHTVSRTAAHGRDNELNAALYVESGLEHWKKGELHHAVSEFEEARRALPYVGEGILAWALHAVDPYSPVARRRALDAAAVAGHDATLAQLERFALEWKAGADDDALAALLAAEADPNSRLAISVALARVLLPETARYASSDEQALVLLGQAGARGIELSVMERMRSACNENADAHAQAAQAWLDAGGGMAATLELLAAHTSLGDPIADKLARITAASELSGGAREAMAASTAMLDVVRGDRSGPLLVGKTAAVRLANMEVAPAGCDPRRRTYALEQLESAAGDDTAADAVALGAWSAFVAGDAEAALSRFSKAVEAIPSDVASWEGVRTCAEQLNRNELRAHAASELGARLFDDARAAACWEEAAEIWFEKGNEARAEAALTSAFDRDARCQAFDKLFRRVRDRKDGDTLLSLVRRRLEVSDEPTEMAKLFWEESRVLREKGDHDGALKSLENVCMLEPDHVGALALRGEIAIKHGRFEEAAIALAHLSTLDSAPPKNRLTAGAAAADLFEHKLGDTRRSLEVLIGLHKARLSPLPIRERLARAAARIGAWREATAILEELMCDRTEPEGRIEAARLAMAIYRDKLAAPSAARAAVFKMLEESPGDGEALDMLPSVEPSLQAQRPYLVSGRAAIVSRLSIDPTDVTLVRRLVRIASALGDGPLQHASCSVALALGGAEGPVDHHFAQQLAQRKVRAPQIVLLDSLLKKVLAPGDEGPVSDLFVLLGQTICEALGPTLSGCSVTRRDRIDAKSNLAIRHEIAMWAAAFGVRDFELYVGGKDPNGIQAIANEVPAIVIGSAVTSPLSSLTRARLGRELLGLTRGTTILRIRDENSIFAIVIAACKLGDVAIPHPQLAVLPEIERQITKAMPRRIKRVLPEYCAPLAARLQDPRLWMRRASMSQSRMAALASSDAGVVLRDDFGDTWNAIPKEQRRNEARVEELCRFMLSPSYLELRQQLGLEGPA